MAVSTVSVVSPTTLLYWTALSRLSSDVFLGKTFSLFLGLSLAKHIAKARQILSALEDRIGPTLSQYGRHCRPSTPHTQNKRMTAGLAIGRSDGSDGNDGTLNRAAYHQTITNRAAHRQLSTCSSIIRKGFDLMADQLICKRVSQHYYRLGVTLSES